MRRRKWRKPLLIALLCAVLALSGFYLVKDTNSQLIEEAKMHLMEVADQGALLALKQLEQELRAVHMLAQNAAQDLDAPAALQLANLARRAGNLTYAQLGVADLEGNARSVSGHEFTLSQYDGFWRSVTGEDYISNPTLDPVDGVTRCIFFVTPIWRQGEVAQVLFLSLTADSLMEQMNLSSYGNSSVSYIMNNEGVVILHPHEDQYSNKIYDLLKEVNNDRWVDGFIRSVQANERGAVLLDAGGGQRYLAYAPLNAIRLTDYNIANWNLVVSIPAASVFERSYRVIRRMLLMMALLVAIFLYVLVSRELNERAVARLAYVDPLTGLGNQNRFFRDAGRLLESGPRRRFAAVSLDVNNFKLYNSTLGIGYGDQILVAIATAMRQVMVGGALLARVAGDRFLILMECTAQPSGVERRLEALRRAIRSGLNGDLDLSLAMGVYYLTPGESDAWQAVNRANIARSAIKGRREQWLAVYDGALQRQVSEQALLTEELKRALERREFLVYYQPKVSLATGAVVGAEALVRWQHPTRGLISPSQFVPLAERSGMIGQLDSQVAEMVCADLQRWREDGLAVQPVSVNLSRLELLKNNLSEGLNRMVARHGLPCHLLELEITESVVIEDLPTVRQRLDELSEAGYLISMDDFGTGFSSLSCLEQLHIDVLKIDRGFLTNLDSQRNQNFLRATVALAKSLELTVVIEGVETEEQVHLMRALGCDVAQGYFFGRPSPQPPFARAPDCKAGTSDALSSQPHHV